MSCQTQVHVRVLCLGGLVSLWAGRKCGLVWFFCFYANASVAYVEALVVVLQTPGEQAMRVYVY